MARIKEPQNIPAEWQDLYKRHLTEELGTLHAIRKRYPFKLPTMQSIKGHPSGKQRKIRDLFKKCIACWEKQPYTGGVVPPAEGPRSRPWWFIDAMPSGLWYYDWFIKVSMLLLAVGVTPPWCKPQSDQWYEDWEDADTFDIETYHYADWEDQDIRPFNSKNGEWIIYLGNLATFEDPNGKPYVAWRVACSPAANLRIYYARAHINGGIYQSNHSQVYLRLVSPSISFPWIYVKKNYVLYNVQHNIDLPVEYILNNFPEHVTATAKATILFTLFFSTLGGPPEQAVLELDKNNYTQHLRELIMSTFPVLWATNDSCRIEHFEIKIEGDVSNVPAGKIVNGTAGTDQTFYCHTVNIVATKV